MSAAAELKTKPTQHSVKTLLESGIIADVIVCRIFYLKRYKKENSSIFNYEKRINVIQILNRNYESIIGCSLILMYEDFLDRVVLKMLSLPDNLEPDLSKMERFFEKAENPKKSIKIGLVGKYVELQDSYKSILESLIHAWCC